MHDFKKLSKKMSLKMSSENAKDYINIQTTSNDTL